MRRARARGGVKQWQVRGEVVRLVDRPRLVTDGPTEVPLLKQLRDLGLSPARERQARLFFQELRRRGLSLSKQEWIDVAQRLGMTGNSTTRALNALTTCELVAIDVETSAMTIFEDQPATGPEPRDRRP